MSRTSYTANAIIIIPCIIIIDIIDSAVWRCTGVMKWK